MGQIHVYVKQNWICCAHFIPISPSKVINFPTSQEMYENLMGSYCPIVRLIGSHGDTIHQLQLWQWSLSSLGSWICKAKLDFCLFAHCIPILLYICSPHCSNILEIVKKLCNFWWDYVLPCYRLCPCLQQLNQVNILCQGYMFVYNLSILGSRI